jgi:hypothetical protein
LAGLTFTSPTPKAAQSPTRHVKQPESGDSALVTPTVT